MKQLFTSIFILSTVLVVNAQDIKRTLIKGRVIVQVNDVEGVTVFNTSSNQGTITDAKGEFSLEVALNDILEFSALQFEKFTVKIDEEMLKNEYLTVYLVEKLNKLDEVIITPYDMLTGNLVVDVNSVKTFNPDLDAIYFGVGEIYAYDFTDDYKSKPDLSILREGEFYNGVDIGAVLGMLLKPIFKKKDKNKTYQHPGLINYNPKDLSDVYGREFLSQTFKIPEDKIEAFIAYVQSDNFDFNLLEEQNEVKLIEHLYKKSQQFLKEDGGKN